MTLLITLLIAACTINIFSQCGPWVTELTKHNLIKENGPGKIPFVTDVKDHLRPPYDNWAIFYACYSRFKGISNHQKLTEQHYPVMFSKTSWILWIWSRKLEVLPKRCFSSSHFNAYYIFSLVKASLYQTHAYWIAFKHCTYSCSMILNILYNCHCFPFGPFFLSGQALSRNGCWSW